MKMTNSKDGIPRATINIAYRISNDERQFIAFVKDYDEDDNPTPKFRIASRAETVEAIKDGFFSSLDWGEDVGDAYQTLKESTQQNG